MCSHMHLGLFVHRVEGLTSVHERMKVSICAWALALACVCIKYRDGDILALLNVREGSIGKRHHRIGEVVCVREGKKKEES